MIVEGRKMGALAVRLLSRLKPAGRISGDGGADQSRDRHGMVVWGPTAFGSSSPEPDYPCMPNHKIASTIVASTTAHPPSNKRPRDTNQLPINITTRQALKIENISAGKLY